MSGHRHDRRDERGRFRAASGDERKAQRAERAPRRPQVVRHSKALTRREMEIFLSALGETCNVRLAAREAKRSPQTFYRLRQRDSGFRAAWLEALATGYDLLEMELLHRCRFGTPKDVFHQGRKISTTRTFNDQAALRLLHFHRKTVEPFRQAHRSGKRDAKAIFDDLAARVAQIKAEKAAKARKNGDGES